MPLAPGLGYQVTAFAAPAAGVEGPPVHLQAQINGRQMPGILLADRGFTAYRFDLDAEATRSGCCPVEFLANEASFRVRTIRVTARGSAVGGGAAAMGADR
jgi:hypothetical protein